MADKPSAPDNGPETGPEPRSYEVVVHASDAGTLVYRTIQGVDRGLSALTGLLGDIYAVGARGVLNRKEALEDRLAERHARRSRRSTLPPPHTGN